MLQPRISSPLRRVLFSSFQAATRCQWQASRRPYNLQFASHQRQFTSATILRLPAYDPAEPKKDGEPEFVPQPLGRPIGFPNPPKAGENLGLKKKKVYVGRTMSERNLERREDIVEKWGKNYFRDFKNIRKYRSGKTFMANPKVFRREAALYFPNFHGQSLAENNTDTTPTLQGKISVVNMYSSHWGEMQAQTFTGKKENPQLAQLLEENKDVAQMVHINVEENTMKAWIVALFQWRLRRVWPKEDWGKYFVIRKGVSERIRETIGMLNGRVGYIYLLDDSCKIRWAGSADAEGDEKEYLNKSLQRLIRESKDLKARQVELEAQSQLKAQGPSNARIEEELEAQAVNAGAS